MRESYSPGKSVGGEFCLPREPISPESLLRDNQSLEADRRRQEWEENRVAKQLTLILTCSDARLFTPNPTSSVIIRSIAAAKPLKSFVGLINHKSIDNVLILGHHSGMSLSKGAPPEGCGGLGVRKNQVKEAKRPRSSVERWVVKNVVHSDVLKQAYAKAKEAQELTGKEILLATQDHIDFTIYPMAALLEDFRLADHMRNVDLTNYDQSQVYAEGIPHLPTGTLRGSSFEAYLAKYDQALATYHAQKFGHDRTAQEIQRPKILWFTTDIRPPEVRCPETTRRPNTSFVITLAREKLSNGVHILNADIIEAMIQAEYPIHHFGRSIKTIFVETGNYEESRRVAMSLLRKDDVRDWIKTAGIQIIIAETRAGKFTNIDYL